MATLQEIIDKSLTSNYDRSVSAPYTNVPGAQLSSQGGMMSTQPTAPVVSQSIAPAPRTPVSTPVVSAPVVTTPTEPTVGAALGYNMPEFETYGDQSILDYYKKESKAPLTEQQLYRKKLKQFQAEIDATNRIYDQMRREEQVAGEGRLGSQSAIAARGGILGSDFASAQTDKVTGYNRELIRGVEDQRQAKIGGILGTVRKAAADEFAAKNAARKSGVESLLGYYKNQQETKNKNVQKIASSLIAQGIDPTTLSEEELSAITSGLGTTKENVFDAYTTAKASIDQGAEFTLSEGQARYDSKGNVIASKGKTYAPNGSTTRTADYNKTLLGGGWSGAQIDALESGIEEYGLQEVIAQEKANGATPAQIKALEQAYKVEDNGEQFLTKDFFSSLYGPETLKTEAAKAGYTKTTGGEDWIPFNQEDGVGDGDAYLSSLETLVQQYRNIGYTDKDILKMMQ